METEHDVFGQWAAEEFVAAGRADDRERRSAHRRRAVFFADIYQELGAEQGGSKPASPRSLPLIGQLLARAFGRRDDQGG